LAPARLGQRRKIFPRQVCPRSNHRGHLDAALVFRDPDVRLRQRLHDLVEFLRGQRQRSALGDGGLASTPQRNLKIGGKKTDVVALRLHQPVGEDRDRVLAFDDPLKKLQFSQEVVLADDEFHISADLESGGGTARDPLGIGEIRE
jgi:hypothetical protein